MQIIRFTAKDVHGYLNFDIKPDPDLTFLHGINGQGKTTAIRAVVALMNFELTWLAKCRYGEMNLVLSDENKRITISTTKKDGQLFFRVQRGSFDQRMTVDLPPEDFFKDKHNQKIDDEVILRHAQYTTNDSRFAIVRFFQTLKKPLYLGLDRTTLNLAQDDNRPQLVDRRREINSRTHLDASLLDAEEIARDAYSEYQRARETAAAQIREQIPLILFRPIEGPSIWARPFQTEKSEMRRSLALLRSMRSRILDSYVTLATNKSEIHQVISDYFDKLIAAKERALDLNFRSDFKVSSREMEVLIEVNRLEASLPFIERIQTLLENFREGQEQSYAAFSLYTNVVNGFISDSNKHIEFSASGRIVLRLPNGDEGDVRQLSSGERQLFVLLTHLAFRNQKAGRDILIIDEPELSLHIAWQMQFVEAIQKVSPSTQIILATHSPSIILDRNEKCVSLVA
jgi:predicted ATP-binding protein involved in virulence